jgi:hypothetical protein
VTGTLPAKDPQSGAESLIRSWHRAASGSMPLPCPLCDSPDSPLGPYDVLLVCPHSATAAARAQAVPLLVSLLARIYSELHVIRERTRLGHWRPAPPSALEEAKARAANVATSCATWTPADRDFTLYRLLLAIPWGTSPALPDSATVSIAMGAAFDSTAAPHHLLHDVLNRWVLTAGRLAASIVSAWGTGVQQAWEAAGLPRDRHGLGHPPHPGVR